MELSIPASITFGELLNISSLERFFVKSISLLCMTLIERDEPDVFSQIECLPVKWTASCTRRPFSSTGGGLFKLVEPGIQS